MPGFEISAYLNLVRSADSAELESANVVVIATTAAQTRGFIRCKADMMSFP
jgi:hypothetical protein